MNLEHIDEDKKMNIINASLCLFSKNGYKHTTTESITKNANISKGLLFHYFKNKKTLYFYLYDYSVQLIVDEIMNKKESTSDDFFEYVKENTKNKWKMMETYPYIYLFLISSVKEEDKEIKEYVMTKTKELRDDSWNEVIKKVDRSKFKHPEDLEKVIHLITYYSNGLMKEFVEQENFDIKNGTKQFMEIIDMFKRNFYKDEYVK